MKKVVSIVLMALLVPSLQAETNRTYIKVCPNPLGVLLAGCLLFCSIAMIASTEEVQVKHFEHWKSLPSWDLFRMTNRFLQTNRPDSALVCCIILSNRYDEKMKTEEKGICCGAMVMASNLYMNTFYDYNRAEQYILQAEKVATDHGYDMQLADIYEIEAGMYSYRTDLQNNFAFDPQAIEMRKKAFNQSIKSHVDHIVTLSFVNMAYVAMKFFRVEDIAKEIDIMNKKVFADTVPNAKYAKTLALGLQEYREKDYEKALMAFNELEAYADKAHQNAQKRFLSNAALFQYITYRTMNRDVEALGVLDRIEQMWQEEELSDVLVEIYQMKMDYFEDKGNTEKAREYELLYMRTKDQFIQKCNMVKSQEAKFLFQLHEMGEEVKDLTYQRKMRDIIIGGVLLLTLLIIGVLVMVWWDYRKTKERNLILYNKNVELMAIDEERRKQYEEAFRQQKETPATEKYKGSPMDEEAKNELLNRLYAIMETHKEAYEEGFSIDSLAVLAHANPNYVSQVINEKKGCNFNNFVNEYRIKEACRRMHNQKEYGHLTIEGIGQSLGFKSRANFASVFKTFTGLTPSAYLKMAREKSGENIYNEKNR